ncbi:MAG TPA: hypothetical protein VF082_12675 [Jiangellaceae bacterium]
MPNPTDKPTVARTATVDDAELTRLREENARLREELAEARENAKAVPNTRPQPVEPSFGLSEGERADLEALDQRREAGEKVPDTITSPFTGRQRGVDEDAKG